MSDNYSTDKCSANKSSVQLPNVQTSDRSSADSEQFRAGKAHYSFVRANKPTQYASHADYLRYKRMQVQLHSTNYA